MFTTTEFWLGFAMFPVAILALIAIALAFWPYDGFSDESMICDTCTWKFGGLRKKWLWDDAKQLRGEPCSEEFLGIECPHQGDCPEPGTTLSPRPKASFTLHVLLSKAIHALIVFRGPKHQRAFYEWVERSNNQAAMSQGHLKKLAVKKSWLRGPRAYRS